MACDDVFDRMAVCGMRNAALARSIVGSSWYYVVKKEEEGKKKSKEAGLRNTGLSHRSRKVPGLVRGS